MRQHSLRLPDELMEAIDGTRGLVPRNAWIVQVLESAVVERNIPTHGPELARTERESPPAIRAKALNRVKDRSPKAESRTYVAENPETLPKVPVRLPKAERLEKARMVVQQRPIIQKRSK